MGHVGGGVDVGGGGGVGQDVEGVGAEGSVGLGLQAAQGVVEIAGLIGADDAIEAVVGEGVGGAGQVEAGRSGLGGASLAVGAVAGCVAGVDDLGVAEVVGGAELETARQASLAGGYARVRVLGRLVQFGVPVYRATYPRRSLSRGRAASAATATTSLGHLARKRWHREAILDLPAAQVVFVFEVSVGTGGRVRHPGAECGKIAVA